MTLGRGADIPDSMLSKPVEAPKKCQSCNLAETQERLDAMRLAIQGFVDAWIECGCWPDADSEKNAVDQAFNECKKVLTAELQREPIGGDL